MRGLLVLGLAAGLLVAPTQAEERRATFPLVDAQTDDPIVPTAVPEEMIWDCVTCGACVQACPVSIEHVDHIVDLRRHMVMVESQFPTEAEPMLMPRGFAHIANPSGGTEMT